MIAYQGFLASLGMTVHQPIVSFVANNTQTGDYLELILSKRSVLAT
jgi:hypothetical protein